MAVEGADVVQLADRALRKQLLRQPRRGRLAEREPGGEAHAGFLGSLDQRLALAHCRGEGLLHQQVLPPTKASETKFRVRRRRCRQDDSVHLRIVGKRNRVGTAFDACAGERPRQILACVRNRGEPEHLRHLRERLCAHFSDEARADESDAQGLLAGGGGGHEGPYSAG